MSMISLPKHIDYLITLNNTKEEIEPLLTSLGCTIGETISEPVFNHKFKVADLSQLDLTNKTVVIYCPYEVRNYGNLENQMRVLRSPETITELHVLTPISKHRRIFESRYRIVDGKGDTQRQLLTSLAFLFSQLRFHKMLNTTKMDRKNTAWLIKELQALGLQIPQPIYTPRTFRQDHVEADERGLILVTGTPKLHHRKGFAQCMKETWMLIHRMTRLVGTNEHRYFRLVPLNGLDQVPGVSELMAHLEFHLVYPIENVGYKETSQRAKDLNLPYQTKFQMILNLHGGPIEPALLEYLAAQGIGSVEMETSSAASDNCSTQELILGKIRTLVVSDVAPDQAEFTDEMKGIVEHSNEVWFLFTQPNESQLQPVKANLYNYQEKYTLPGYTANKTEQERYRMSTPVLQFDRYIVSMMPNPDLEMITTFFKERNIEIGEHQTIERLRQDYHQKKDPNIQSLLIVCPEENKRHTDPGFLAREFTEIPTIFVAVIFPQGVRLTQIKGGPTVYDLILSVDHTQIITGPRTLFTSTMRFARTDIDHKTTAPFEPIPHFCNRVLGANLLFTDSVFVYFEDNCGAAPVPEMSPVQPNANPFRPIPRSVLLVGQTCEALMTRAKRPEYQEYDQIWLLQMQGEMLLVPFEQPKMPVLFLGARYLLSQTIPVQNQQGAPLGTLPPYSMGSMFGQQPMPAANLGSGCAQGGPFRGFHQPPQFGGMGMGGWASPLFQPPQMKHTITPTRTMDIPEALYDELATISRQKNIPMDELFRKFIKLGLLAISLQDDPDAALIIKEGLRQREIFFF